MKVCCPTEIWRKKFLQILACNPTFLQFFYGKMIIYSKIYRLHTIFEKIGHFY